jgi:small subunit ribosomal protein S8
MPHSKLKTHVAQVLLDQGYIAGYRTEDATVGKSLVVDLKYGPNRERSIAGIKRISKPGLRIYAKSNELPRVLGGLGVASPTAHPRTTAQKSSTRRMPVIGTARTASVRPTRGTTARKVTWS